MTAPRKKTAGSRTAAKDNRMSDTLSDYVTTRQAAELLGVRQTSVNHLLIDGKLQGMKLGNDWLVFRPSLEDYVKTKAASGRPPSAEPMLKT